MKNDNSLWCCQKSGPLLHKDKSGHKIRGKPFTLIISPCVVNTHCDPEDTGKTLKSYHLALKKEFNLYHSNMFFLSLVFTIKH